MTDALNKIALAVFHRQSLRDCSLEELKTMTEQYPWFAAARLLYTKKLKEADPEKFSEEISTAALYVSNPLWLDYILNETETITHRANFDEKIQTGAYKEVPVEDFRNDEVVIANGNGKKPELSAEVNKAQVETGITNKTRAEKQTGFETGHDQAPVPVADTGSLQEEGKEQELIFEPYHTVDYFASQGIKNVQENDPPDRFGKQLKSFTEWLKTLKRIPGATASSEPEPGAEEKVISLAQQSIDDREVLTETMADVWIRQGATEKAIDIYNKLSLLNPAKSSYFAGLIEKLKQP